MGIKDSSVKNTLQLLEVGATIPFIARYRKEKTGSLDEVQIADIQTQFKKLIELNNRKESILETIDEQGKLTNELKDKIIKSWNSIEIEDLYLPYKKRKKTRADIARENGLETLAELIMSQRGQDLYFAAGDCINEKVKTAEEAIQGAKDIIAEWISEDQDIRDKLRISFRRFGVLISKVVTKKKEDAEKYKDYFDFSGALFKCPSHRFLAILRGGNEGILKVSVQIEEDRALEMIERKFIKTNGKHGEYIAEAISDSYKRLIFPSIENQILNLLLIDKLISRRCS